MGIEGHTRDHSLTSKLTVSVIGSGNLGNALCEELGPLELREVLLIDSDRIEQHNLPSCSLLRSGGLVGQGKANALATICQSIFPNTTWRAIQAEIADVGFAAIANSDILFSCVDNELARLEIAYIGLKLNIPVCDAGVKDSKSGRVSFFPGGKQASFCCLLPPSRRRELLSRWSSPAFPCWSAAPDETVPWQTAPEAAELAASLQVKAALNYFSQDPKDRNLLAQTTEFRLTPEPELSTSQLPVSTNCPFHEEASENSVLLPAASDMTVRELLNAAERGRRETPVLILDWPVCTLARCLACGLRMSKTVRVSALRRTERCPKCGSERLVPITVVQRITQHSDLASRRLQDLGIPENHLHTIQYQSNLTS